MGRARMLRLGQVGGRSKNKFLVLDGQILGKQGLVSWEGSDDTGMSC